MSEEPGTVFSDVMQVGITIVAFEYERQRVKEVAKKKQEADERMAILERARQEQEVWSPHWHLTQSMT